ncbi:Chromosome-associated kinesin kif4a [Phlyctochytrium planicorne]|nr:Chromosome-associated kinesin kif4a [Phlyctochytrium planicorne]
MASGQPATTAVKVALRIRPVFDKDKTAHPRGSREAVIVPQSGADIQDSFPRQIIVDGRKRFTYDRVFAPGTSQLSVYDHSVKGLVDGFVGGFNATVMAYGQTGSGKTYTMGSSEEYVSPNATPNPNEGIISRALKDLFAILNSKAQAGQFSFTLSATFLEVYNEELIDLLSSQRNSTRTPIIIQETGSGSSLSGCEYVKVSSAEEAIRLFSHGLQNRRTSTTAMNISSSRSHAIFSLTLSQESRTSADPSVRPTAITSRFHFVDLAGSERLQRTGSIGVRQREGIHINSGLLALGNVISALGDDSGRTTHIPYRDSKLTRLLQDSLGGNSNTLMIACISPIEHDLSETLNTLKYANRAHKVRNLPLMNKDVADEEVLQLRDLVQKLQDEIKTLKTTPGNVSEGPVTPPAPGAFEALQKENQTLRRQLEERKEENLRLKAHRDYLANELAFVQSESTLRIMNNNSPAPSESMSDIFSDNESVFSNTTGVSSVFDNDSTVAGSTSSRLPIATGTKKHRQQQRPSAIPRSTTPGTSSSQTADSLMSTVEEQDRLIRRLRFDLREMTSAAQDYLRQLEIQRNSTEHNEAAIELGEAQAADLRDSVMELRSSLEASEAKVAGLELKLKQSEADHLSADEYISGLEAQLARRDGLAAQVERLEADLEDARAEEARREAILADLERRLASSGDSVETIARMTHLEQEVTKFREAWQAAQTRLDEMIKESGKDTLLSPPRSAPASPPKTRSLDIIPEETSANTSPVGSPTTSDLLRRLNAAEETIENYKKELDATKEEKTALASQLAMSETAPFTRSQTPNSESDVQISRLKSSLEDAISRASAAETKLDALLRVDGEEDVEADDETSATSASDKRLSTSSNASSSSGLVGGLLNRFSWSEKPQPVAGDDVRKRLEQQELSNEKLRAKLKTLRKALKTLQVASSASPAKVEESSDRGLKETSQFLPIPLKRTPSMSSVDSQTDTELGRRRSISESNYKMLITIANNEAEQLKKELAELKSSRTSADADIQTEEILDGSAAQQIQSFRAKQAVLEDKIREIERIFDDSLRAKAGNASATVPSELLYLIRKENENLYEIYVALSKENILLKSQIESLQMQLKKAEVSEAKTQTFDDNRTDTSSQTAMDDHAAGATREMPGEAVSAKDVDSIVPLLRQENRNLYETYVAVNGENQALQILVSKLKAKHEALQNALADSQKSMEANAAAKGENSELQAHLSGLQDKYAALEAALAEERRLYEANIATRQLSVANELPSQVISSDFDIVPLLRQENRNLYESYENVMAEVSKMQITIHELQEKVPAADIEVQTDVPNATVESEIQTETLAQSTAEIQTDKEAEKIDSEIQTEAVVEELPSLSREMPSDLPASENIDVIKEENTSLRNLLESLQTKFDALEVSFANEKKTYEQNLANLQVNVKANSAPSEKTDIVPLLRQENRNLYESYENVAAEVSALQQTIGDLNAPKIPGANIEVQTDIPNATVETEIQTEALAQSTAEIQTDKEAEKIDSEIQTEAVAEDLPSLSREMPAELPSSENVDAIKEENSSLRSLLASLQTKFDALEVSFANERKVFEERLTSLQVTVQANAVPTKETDIVPLLRQENRNLYESYENVSAEVSSLQQAIEDLMAPKIPGADIEIQTEALAQSTAEMQTEKEADKIDSEIQTEAAAEELPSLSREMPSSENVDAIKEENSSLRNRLTSLQVKFDALELSFAGLQVNSQTNATVLQTSDDLDIVPLLRQENRNLYESYEAVLAENSNLHVTIDELKSKASSSEAEIQTEQAAEQISTEIQTESFEVASTTREMPEATPPINSKDSETQAIASVAEAEMQTSLDVSIVETQTETIAAVDNDTQTDSLEVPVIASRELVSESYIQVQTAEASVQADTVEEDIVPLLRQENRNLFETYEAVRAENNSLLLVISGLESAKPEVASSLVQTEANTGAESSRDLSFSEERALPPKATPSADLPSSEVQTDSIDASDFSMQTANDGTLESLQILLAEKDKQLEAATDKVNQMEAEMDEAKEILEQASDSIDRANLLEDELAQLRISTHNLEILLIERDEKLNTLGNASNDLEARSIENNRLRSQVDILTLTLQSMHSSRPEMIASDTQTARFEQRDSDAQTDEMLNEQVSRDLPQTESSERIESETQTSSDMSAFMWQLDNDFKEKVTNLEDTVKQKEGDLLKQSAMLFEAQSEIERLRKQLARDKLEGGENISRLQIEIDRLNKLVIDLRGDLKLKEENYATSTTSRSISMGDFSPDAAIENKQLKDEIVSLKARLRNLSELKTQLLETASRHYTSEEMKAAQDRIAELEALLAKEKLSSDAFAVEFRAKVERLGEENSKLSKALEDALRKCVELANRIQGLEKEIEQLSVDRLKEKSDLESRIRQLEDSARAALKEAQAAKESADSRYADLMRRFNETTSTLTIQLESSKQKLAQQEATIRQLEDRISELTGAHEDVLLQARTVEESLQHHKATLENERATRELHLNKSTQQLADLKNQNRSLQRDLGGALDQVRQKDETLHKLQMDITITYQHLQEAKAAQAEATSKIETLTSELQSKEASARDMPAAEPDTASADKIVELTHLLERTQWDSRTLESLLHKAQVDLTAKAKELEELKEKEAAASARELPIAEPSPEAEKIVELTHLLERTQWDTRTLESLLHKTQADLASKSKELDELKEKEATFRELPTETPLPGLTDKVVELTHLLERTQWDSKTLENLLHKAQADLASKSKELDELKEKEAAASTSRDIPASEPMPDLSKKVTELTHLLERTQWDCKTLENLLHKAQADLAASAKEVQELKAIREAAAEKEREIGNLRSHIAELDGQAAEAAAIAAAAEKLQKAQLEDAAKIAGLESEVVNLKSNLDDKTKKLTGLQVDMENLKIRNREKEESTPKIHSLQARVKELEYQLSVAESQKARPASSNPSSPTRSLKGVFSPTSPTLPASTPRSATRTSLDGIPDDASVMSLWRNLAKSEDHGRKQAEEIKRLEDRILEQQQSLNEAKDAVLAMEVLVTKSSQAYKDASGQLEDAKKEIQDLNSRIKDLEGLVSERSGHSEVMRAQIEQHSQDRALANQNVEDLSAKLRKLQADYDELLRQLKEEKEKVADLEESAKVDEKSIDELRDLLSSRTGELGTRQKKIEDLLENMAAVASEKSSVNSLLEAERTRSLNLEDAVKKQAERIALLETEIEEMSSITVDHQVKVTTQNRSAAFLHMAESVEEEESIIHNEPTPRRTQATTTSRSMTSSSTSGGPMKQGGRSLESLESQLAVERERNAKLEEEIKLSFSRTEELHLLIQSHYAQIKSLETKNSELFNLSETLKTALAKEREHVPKRSDAARSLGSTPPQDVSTISSRTVTSTFETAPSSAQSTPPLSENGSVDEQQRSNEKLIELTHLLERTQMDCKTLEGLLIRTQNDLAASTKELRDLKAEFTIINEDRNASGSKLEKSQADLARAQAESSRLTVLVQQLTIKLKSVYDASTRQDNTPYLDRIEGQTYETRSIPQKNDSSDAMILSLRTERDEARREAIRLERLLSSYASTSTSKIPSFEDVSRQFANLKQELGSIREQRDAMRDHIITLRDQLDAANEAFARVAGVRLYNRNVQFASSAEVDVQIVRPIINGDQIQMYKVALDDAHRQLNDQTTKQATALSYISKLEAENADQIDTIRQLQGGQQSQSLSRNISFAGGDDRMQTIRTLEKKLIDQSSEIVRLTAEIERLNAQRTPDVVTNSRGLSSIPEDVESPRSSANESLVSDYNLSRSPQSTLRRRARASGAIRSPRGSRSGSMLADKAAGEESSYLDDEDMGSDYFLPSVFFNDLVPPGEIPSEAPVKHPLRVLLTMRRVSQISSREYVEQIGRHVVNLDAALRKANARIIELQRKEDELKIEVDKGKTDLKEALRSLSEAESSRQTLELKWREARKRKGGLWCLKPSLEDLD